MSDPWDSAHAVMDRHAGDNVAAIRRGDGRDTDERLGEDYIHVFTSTHGVRVLDDLKRRFGGVTLGKTPDESHARAAMAAVVLHIETKVADAIAKR